MGQFVVDVTPILLELCEISWLDLQLFPGNVENK